jgi:hypothetical protein
MTLDVALVEPMVSTLKTLFSVEETNKIARASKFVERSTSRLSGRMFLLMNVLRTEGHLYHSLQDQCSYLEETFGVVMRKQSLDERYGPQAVSFMRTCFAKVLSASTNLGGATTLGSSLTAIHLCDATSFKLSDSLKSAFPGSGTAAGVKIFYSYELLSGQCTDIQWVAGKRNDTTYLNSIERNIEPRSLYIKDLGFWSTGHFGKIHQAEAYFVTRYKVPNNVYCKVGEALTVLDLQVILKDIEQPTVIEDLFLGEDQIPVRLHAEKVPDEVAEKRRKKIRHKAACNNAVSSELSLFLCQYSIFITNAPQSVLPIEHIRAFYMLRWQIELIFKAWKSIFELERVQRMNPHRFECYLMGKLMAVLLSSNLQNLIKAQLWEEQQFELSEWKAHKIFKKNFAN